MRRNSTAGRARRLTLLMASVALLAGVAVVSHAEGFSGVQKIGVLHNNASGHVQIFGAVGAWNNPDSCDVSDRLILQRSHSQWKELFATVLSAQMTETDFSAFLNGCVDVGGVTYPKVVNINTYQ